MANLRSLRARRVLLDTCSRNVQDRATFRLTSFEIRFRVSISRATGFSSRTMELFHVLCSRNDWIVSVVFYCCDVLLV